MLKPRRNKLVYLFFSWYINRIIKRSFTGFNFNKPGFDTDKSILLLANHFSWWDAFWLFQVNRLYFNKNFHVMITEENYKKVWFFKYLGAFSVNKTSRNVLLSLTYAGELLNDPNNLVLLFPQGRLYSNHVAEVSFQKGLLQLINASDKNFQYLFAATFVDYLQNKKPVVTCYLQKREAGQSISLQQIKTEYNVHYQNSKQLQSTINL